MAKRKSLIPPALVEGLRGNLAQTNIMDLLQFLSVARKTGALTLEKLPEMTEGHVYFAGGDIVHGVAGRAAGMEALAEVCDWSEGNFRFFEDVQAPSQSVTLKPQHALLEVVRMHDERLRFTKERAVPERSSPMQPNTRTSTDVLEDLLKVPGVTSAVVVGRDGFIIESAGGSNSVAQDDLGAALAHAVNGIEEMGTELQVNKFQDLFVEYGRAVIMCRPLGDAILAIVAPDASKLGIIRHKAKPFADELTKFF
jgi:predicted regulator of Ras-like GTPase activity (Roadblock/LC7/MglB family)